MRSKHFRKLAVSALVAIVMCAVAALAPPLAQADDHAKCQHKIEKAESKLDEAIRKHGQRSSQAEGRRRDLNAERERCWNAYHGWWDGHERRWHDVRDWNNQ